MLLTGGSSVGKTRCAAEAVKALLPDWWLIHPVGPTEVAELAAVPPARAVVWLDELQRYLDGKHGLTGGVVRALLRASGTIVIIGTLWPDRYAAYTAVPLPGRADPHERAREVLELAVIIRVGAQFTAAEQGRARLAAARDPRLAAAVKADGYGLTQTLAAAPQLVARWEDAQQADPYAWAVLTAALDAVRLGARASLTAGLLRAAAPGYCTGVQQAEAPSNWFERALAYATGKLYGAAAALAPTGADMGRIDGYTVADYLLQHATRERRAARVPASTWDALLGHIRDTADTLRLADSAKGRLLNRYAILLYRHAADAGHRDAALRLNRLLVDQEDLDELRARAQAGDEDAAAGLDRVLADRGDLDELRARARTGDWFAAEQLANCDLDRLRALANVGYQGAVYWLDNMLARGGELDELRARARAGDQYAARLLADCRDLDELRARADTGGQFSTLLLAHRGDLDRGDLDELRARADADDETAAPWLATLLYELGHLDELRARADAGDEWAAARLDEMLASRGSWMSSAPAPTPATRPPPPGWTTCWPAAGNWTSSAPAPTPARHRRRPAGQHAGQPRGTGRAPHPRRRRRRDRRRPAGQHAGQPRGTGRAPHPRRRRRRYRRRPAGQHAGQPRGTGRAPHPRR